MESQELLHPENSEIQNNEVNAEVSQETQTVNENATPASAVEPEIAEPVTEPQPETSAEEPAAEETAPEVEQPAAEPVAEEKPADEPVEAPKAVEPEQPAETLEQVEAEYADFDLEKCVAELERLVEERNFNIIKQRVGVIRAKALEFLRERRRARQAEFEAAKSAAEAAAAELPEGQEAPAMPEFNNEPDELEKRFNTAFQTFKDNKAAFIEELEQQKTKNLELKNNIIEGLKRRAVESRRSRAASGIHQPLAELPFLY